MANESFIFSSSSITKTSLSWAYVGLVAVSSAVLLAAAALSARAAKRSISSRSQGPRKPL